MYFKYAYLSRFLSTVKKNECHQRKLRHMMQIYRQIYPQIDFLCEPSLDIDSTYVAIKAFIISSCVQV